MLTPKSFRLLICVLLSVLGCGHDQRTGQQPSSIEEFRQAGQSRALSDLAAGNAGIYVFRQVATDERDPETGLPLRDAGSDAVSPDKAAFVQGYNQAVSAVARLRRPASTESSLGQANKRVPYSFSANKRLPDDQAKIEAPSLDGRWQGL